ncbi:hypothetical protein QL285_025800 [Trifolium repens]|nr:hypothetical protein QL285_025800 [Trifolium repens]
MYPQQQNQNWSSTNTHKTTTPATNQPEGMNEPPSKRRTHRRRRGTVRPENKVTRRISRKPPSHHHNHHVYILSRGFGLKGKEIRERVSDLFFREKSIFFMLFDHLR